MMFTLENDFATLGLDLSRGGKILFLEFKTNQSKIQVIQSREGSDFYLSGSYFLFPWVNRISSPSLNIRGRKFVLKDYKTDANGLPIHGFYTEAPRRILSQTPDSVTIAPVSFHPDFPIFQETFILKEKQFVCKTEFWNKTSSLQAFAYGYHPYLEFEKPIDELELIIEPELWVPLDEKLLPTEKKEPTSKLFPSSSLRDVKLDHLFLEERSEDARISLRDPLTGQTLRCVGRQSLQPEQIPLPFFQVYTHPDRNCIAIEPQTSPGNVFAHSHFEPVYLEPNSYKWGEWNIEISLDQV